MQSVSSARQTTAWRAIPRYNQVVRSGKQKAIALALGFVCTLALAEGALRLLGAVSSGAGPRQGKADLLCLGNSYTAGIGAPRSSLRH